MQLSRLPTMDDPSAPSARAKSLPPDMPSSPRTIRAPGHARRRSSDSRVAFPSPSEFFKRSVDDVVVQPDNWDDDPGEQLEAAPFSPSSVDAEAGSVIAEAGSVVAEAGSVVAEGGSFVAEAADEHPEEEVVVGPNGRPLQQFTNGINHLTADLAGPDPDDPLDEQFTYLLPEGVITVEQQRKKNANFLAERNERLSPVYTLPDELLTYCLELTGAWLDQLTMFTLLNIGRPQSLVNRPPWHALAFTRTARTVCKRWNRIVLRTPRLWRWAIWPPVQGGISRVYGFPIADVMRRTGGVPLDVYITDLGRFERTAEYGTLFNMAVVARIRRLEIDDAPVPGLRPGHSLPWTMPWDRLENLSLRKYAVPFCAFLQLLRSAPRLHSLLLQHIVFHHCAEYRTAEVAHECFSCPTTRLPLLEQLHLIKCSEEATGTLCARLIMPRLYHLTIVRPERQSHAPNVQGTVLWPLPLSGVPPHVFARVRHMAYYGDNLTHEELIHTLDYLPSLEVLSIGARYIQFDEQELWQALWEPDAAGDYLIPHLHTLLLQNCMLFRQTADTLVTHKRTQGRELVMLGLCGSQITNFDNYQSEQWEEWCETRLRGWVGLEAYGVAV
ncbi:hypothetical protein CALVIDRAFT_257318 [Calocera viscosa TUFC12733]|uniref:F-box domain-containing protein n=1 Tax=Calocera viscosa (strain TUFC12733) TaxID=1330018 RepID=A0A167JA85_CALVF|nr:hypothetical protein CALVIDRAFT_257318 [Calocera viscosa TUFC12733]